MASLVSIYRRFPDREAAVAHLESVRWPSGPTCPYCASPKASRNNDGSRTLTAARWQCQACRRSYSVTVGTIFHGSHIDLQRWYLLIALMLNAKKGLSSMQAARDLEMRQPTVWSMIGKIRQAKPGDHRLAMLVSGEEWRPVVGFESLYEVSNLGAIRSLRSGALKASHANARGYMHTTLHERGGRNVYVPRAVLESFAGPCPDGMEACHWNGVRGDNTLINLRWDTSKRNHADRLTHGTHTRGERNAKAKLTADDVSAIRNAVAGGGSQAAIARQFGVSKHAVNDIIHRRTWDY